MYYKLFLLINDHELKKFAIRNSFIKLNLIQRYWSGQFSAKGIVHHNAKKANFFISWTTHASDRDKERNDRNVFLILTIAKRPKRLSKYTIHKDHINGIIL
jgi:hypothetical protein